MLTTPRKIGLNIKSEKKVTLMVKDLPVNAGDRKDAGSIPGMGRSSGVGNGNPLQYSCQGNLMDRGAWWPIVHGTAQRWTRVSTQAHTHMSNEAQKNTSYQEARLEDVTHQRWPRLRMT